MTTKSTPVRRRAIAILALAACLALAVAGCQTSGTSYSSIRRSLGRGSLKVTSDPPNARVYINHRYAGRTPFAEGFKRGELYVMVKKAGYRTAGEWPQIIGGQTVDLHFKLEPLE